MEKVYEAHEDLNMAVVERAVQDMLDAALKTVARCGECKYWSEPVDEVDGKLYGQCERPITAIKRTSLVSETWYCADAERKGA